MLARTQNEKKKNGNAYLNIKFCTRFEFEFFFVLTCIWLRGVSGDNREKIVVSLKYTSNGQAPELPGIDEENVEVGREEGGRLNVSRYIRSGIRMNR